MPRLFVDAVFDLESFVLEAIEHTLRLNPNEETETGLEAAKHMLRRAREELNKGDAVQARNSTKQLKSASRFSHVLRD